MNLLIQAGGNNEIDFKPVFEMLNDELAKIDKSLEIVCAGGYVMQLHGYAATMDVDAFYNSNAEIEAVIRKVGDAFQMNRPDEIWLNNSVMNLNRKPPASCYKPKYIFTHLTVNIVDLEYVLGMKLELARTKDIEHVSSFIKHNNYDKPFDLLSQLRDVGFRNIDVSVLFQAFGEAYGIEWLEKFYRDNESEIMKYS